METASSPATTSSTRTSQVGVFILKADPIAEDHNKRWNLFFTDSWDHMYTTRNISPTNNQANIVELHPACVYSIRMYSYNKIGRSLPSKELTISTEEARKLCPPELSSPFCILWSFHLEVCEFYFIKALFDTQPPMGPRWM